MNKYSWARTHLNGYEVTTRGDKEYSAFNAYLPDGRSIEEHYQCDVKGYDPGGKNWRRGKGQPSLATTSHRDGSSTTDELFDEYLILWRLWATKAKLTELRKRMGTKTILTDMFGWTKINQAHALSILLNELEE